MNNICKVGDLVVVSFEAESVKGGTYKHKALGIVSMKDVNKTVYIVDSYHPTLHGIWEKDEILSCFIRILNKAKEKI